MEANKTWIVEYSDKYKWLRIDDEYTTVKWEQYACSTGFDMGFVTIGRGYMTKQAAMSVALLFAINQQLDFSQTQCSTWNT